MKADSLKNWLKYYRASLIDASRGTKNSMFPDSIIRENFDLDCFTAEETKAIWDKDNIYSFKIGDLVNNESDIAEIYNKKDVEYQIVNLGKNPKKVDALKFNKIEIAPIFIQNDKEHSEIIGDDKIHYPFWIPAYVEDGKLYAPIEDEIPAFLREYLSPNPSDSPIIADMSMLDSELSNYDFSRNSWEQYWKDCQNYFSLITGKEYADFQKDNIKLKICKYENVNTTFHIMKIYNSLIFENHQSTFSYPVLQKLLEAKPEHKITETKEIEDILIPNHYGSMEGEFPLSKSQREAFAKSQYENHSDIFAINGPPGTGKTTILQSFIANSLVNAVLNNEQPPLIVGCSTNNQAITNILDSMKLKNPSNIILQERWIPEVNSFGMYLTGLSKSAEDLKDYQYTTSPFFTDGFANKIDGNPDLYEYSNYFLSKLNDYLTTQNLKLTREISIENAQSYLRNLIDDIKTEIDSYSENSKAEYQVAKYLADNEFHSEDKVSQEIATTNLQISNNEKLTKTLEQNKEQFEIKYQSFPFYIIYLPFKKFNDIKENAFKSITKENVDLFSKSLKFSNYYEVQSATDEILIDIQKRLTQERAKVKHLEEILIECKIRHDNYAADIDKWNKKYAAKWNKLIENTKDEYQDLNVIEDMAVKLDISLRHELFWLCVHYREAEFINEQFDKESSNNNNERGDFAYKNRLERLAKITPLFISTFHTLPKYCTYYSYGKGEVFYKGLFDLMIVDEAGQVSPEVAMPSFTFTRKLLTVGDIHQIEPIWGVSKSIDYKNAEKYGLVENQEDFKKLNENGLLASSGSVMKVALHNSHFSYLTKKGELQNGVLLKEHRRCLDSIINFSNKFVYQNSLILKGGNTHDKLHNLPSLGYIHINGECVQQISSNANPTEANTIIEWLKEKQEILQKSYGKTLDEVVAIVTPYSAQKKLLKNLLRLNFNSEISSKLTIGTVHALQGAEKPIILFSPTNSDPKKSLFMNYEGKNNMLNVAITRAKHSFLVFGNMIIFKEGQNSPSSNLAELLYSNAENILNDEFIFEKNTLFKHEGDKISHLTTLQQHRDALKKCLEIATKEIIISSPFISINALNADNISNLIKNAVSKGVQVTILTDDKFDKKDGILKTHSENGRELLKSSGAKLIIYNGIHNKTIFVDDHLLIEGSFNWLSASRDAGYSNKENSIILQGVNVPEKVERIKEMFELG